MPAHKRHIHRKDAKSAKNPINKNNKIALRSLRLCVEYSFLWNNSRWNPSVWFRGYSAIDPSCVCAACRYPVSPTTSTPGGGTKLKMVSSTGALRTTLLKVNEVVFPKLSLASIRDNTPFTKKR